MISSNKVKYQNDSKVWSYTRGEFKFQEIKKKNLRQKSMSPITLKGEMDPSEKLSSSFQRFIRDFFYIFGDNFS